MIKVGGRHPGGGGVEGGGPEYGNAAIVCCPVTVPGWPSGGLGGRRHWFSSEPSTLYGLGN